MKPAKISFYRKYDTGCVYANITCNGSKVSMTTGIEVDKEHFQQGRITGSNIELRKKSQEIEDLRVRVSQIEVKPHYNAKIIRSILKGEYEDGMHEATLMNAIDYGYNASLRVVVASSAKMYGYVVSSFTWWIKNKYPYDDVAIAKVTGSIISEYRDHLMDLGFSPTWASYCMTVLGSFYDEYVQDHEDIIAPINPFRLVNRKMRRLNRRSGMSRKRAIFEQCLTEEMIEKIKNHVFVGPKKHSRNKWRLTALWQIYTGFSFNDLGSKDWKIIDVDGEKMVELYRGKTKNRCPIPLSKEAEDVLERLKELSYGKHIFPTKIFIKGEKTDLAARNASYSRYTRFLDVFSKQLGIPFRTHTFRHTFGMHMSKAGVPMPVIAEMMGHYSVTTTEKFYVRPDDSHVMKAVKATQS